MTCLVNGSAWYRKKWVQSAMLLRIGLEFVTQINVADHIMSFLLEEVACLSHTGTNEYRFRLDDGLITMRGFHLFPHRRSTSNSHRRRS